VFDLLASWGKKALVLVLVYVVLANVLIYVYAAAGVEPPSFLMLYPAVKLKDVVNKLNSTVTTAAGTEISGTVVGQVYQGLQVAAYSVDVWGALINLAYQLVFGLPTLFYELAKAASPYLGAPLGTSLPYIASGVGAVVQAMALFYIAYSIAGAFFGRP